MFEIISQVLGKGSRPDGRDGTRYREKQKTVILLSLNPFAVTSVLFKDFFQATAVRGWFGWRATSLR
ncbi:hypothetical protein PbDSM24746_39370 [Paenibacillus macerans]|nr:hypothetical protein PbDSM24746_39370 [Paenibacillus macerans]GBK70246.1 hypothetical protein PbJCM17693_39540 [Paenibacillus macerans]